MGMAYLLILIVYVAIAISIYKIIKRFTEKVWIKRLVIAFFILLPTYDIIITQALLFYYCNFTEKEKVYERVENPESVYIEDAIPTLKSVSKSDKEFMPKQYLQKKHSLQSLELYNGEKSVLHYSLDADGNIVVAELEKPIARYGVYRRVLYKNWFIDRFLLIRNIVIKDMRTNTVVADLTTYNPRDYNFIVIKGSSVLQPGCKGNIFSQELYILNYAGLKNFKGITDGNK
jgi:hypothetical protein